MSSLQTATTTDRTLAMLRTALGPVITQALDDPKAVSYTHLTLPTILLV